MMAVAADTTIKGYDFRTPKEAYSIDKAHSEGVLPAQNDTLLLRCYAITILTALTMLTITKPNDER